MTPDPQKPNELTALQEAVIALREMRTKLESLQQQRSAPIAVVGMSCRFPGRANSPSEYWDLLTSGRDAISALPAGRFAEQATLKVEQMGAPEAKWGGFVDQIDQFDPGFFGISPREAASMDPQQRVLLEVTWEALEDAGLTIPALAGSKTGVFVGVHSHSSDYYLLQQDCFSGDVHVATGTAHNVIAGRLSYLFDWRGPSMAVDTACSSSLVAVHLAVQSLRSGESDLCVAGGVNLILALGVTIHAARMGMLAPDGRCKPFDEAANGFVRGEGCGVVVLKRLSDAMKEGDPILAVIRGTAVNQDGKSNGLTAPNGLAQEALVRAALENAQVRPCQIGYVETHGTGTALGDPIEADALSRVLADEREAGQVCLLGAAKANIGHLEGAAGIAGFMKTVLVLKNRAVPPQIHFTRLNRHITLGKNFEIPTTLREWPAGTQSHFASVSSFGWSGTNAHIVLEEAGAQPRRATDSNDLRQHLLVLSAHTHEALLAVLHAYVGFLNAQAQEKNSSLNDICYTASARRTHHEHRLAVLGNSCPEITTLLERYLRGDQNVLVWAGRVPEHSERIVSDSSKGRIPPDGTSRTAFLQSLAKDFIADRIIDWAKCFPADSCQVNLPRYPWQRKSYWAEVRHEASTAELLGITPTTTPPSTSKSAPAEWFYQLDWIEKPVPLSGGVRVREDLDSLAQGYCASALENLGFRFEIGALFDEAETIESLRVQAKYTRLCARLFTILSEAGYLEEKCGCWQVQGRPEPAIVSNAAAVAALHPGYRTEFGLLMRCGARLAEILRGKCDPLELLFPDASVLYGESTSLRFYNDVLANLLNRRKLGEKTHPLRILEVGAGTGATTSCILEKVSNSNFRYVFTDVSPSLLRESAERFRDFPTVRSQRLDIESDPVKQGFAAHSFDVVICANVLHATKYLRNTLSHVRSLLKPDGLLLLIETTAPRAWVDLTFGLTDGWWKFADTDLRRRHPLLNANQWAEILHESEFLYTEIVGAGCSRGAPLEGAIFAASPGDRAQNAPPNQSWLILADESGIARCVAERLRARGHDCLLVRAGRAQESGIDPQDYDSYTRLFAGNAFTGVLHLWNADASATADIPLEEIERGHALGFGSIMHLLHGMRQSQAKVWLVTRNAQPVGTADLSLAQTPIWGLGRALALERPDVWGGLIDIDASDPAECADRIVFEIVDSDGEDQIALRGDKRYVARLMSQSAPPIEFMKVRPDASYLITGGFGGLGRKLVQGLAERGARSLVLIGRSDIPNRSEWGNLSESDAMFKTVVAIGDAERLGVVVRVEQVDVGDPVAMGALFDRLRTEVPPIAGVIHCAAVWESRPITEMNETAFQVMFRPKMNGGWILHELTRRLDLDFFVLFSSASSQLGAKFGTHYGAANQFLDGLAHLRRQMHLPALSINWGEWDEMRILTDEQRLFFERSGLMPMESERAIDAMSRLVAAGVTQQIVASIDIPLLKSAFQASGRKPFLEKLRSEVPRDKRQRPGRVATMRELLASVPQGNRRDVIAERVESEVARALGVRPPEKIDPQRGLFEMGMDSLMSVQLRTALEAAFDCVLSPTAVFNHPNVAALTDLFAADLLRTDVFEISDKRAVGSDWEDEIGTIVRLSDEEARTELMRELSSLPPDLDR